MSSARTRAVSPRVTERATLRANMARLPAELQEQINPRRLALQAQVDRRRRALGVRRNSERRLPEWATRDPPDNSRLTRGMVHQFAQEHAANPRRHARFARGVETRILYETLPRRTQQGMRVRPTVRISTGAVNVRPIHVMRAKLFLVSDVTQPTPYWLLYVHKRYTRGASGVWTDSTPSPGERQMLLADTHPNNPFTVIELIE